jgi:hypothetical protein
MALVLSLLMIADIRRLRLQNKQCVLTEKVAA